MPEGLKFDKEEGTGKVRDGRGIVREKRMEIIAVTETWIDTGSKNFETEFKIEGYELFHEDRKGRRGGGVAIML